MTAKREIFHIIFNKFIADGRIRCDEYFLETESPIGKTPESITIRDNRVTVCFTNGERHIFPYDDKVEYFDREEEAKKKK